MMSSVLSRAAAAITTTLLAALAMAGEADIKAVEKAIRASFAASQPDVLIESVAASPLDGFYEVGVANGPQIYVTADGKHFFIGDLYAVMPGGFSKIPTQADQAQQGERARLINEVPLSKMIVFSPPKGVPVRAHVSVFTDVDCYYCQKLHSEMADINRLGVEVRYLGYPRAGIGSDSYKKIASAWCSSNPQEALTKLKLRQAIPEKVCADNPIEAQFELGHKLGVDGTPALVTADGRLLPGYMPAVKLATTLGVKVDPAVAAELNKKAMVNQ